MLGLPAQQPTHRDEQYHPSIQGCEVNSKIKCVLYCVDHNFHPYTQLAVTNAIRWKSDILYQLGEWRREIPQHSKGSPHHHINLLCDIKYHELDMLVLRLNPRLQQPD